MPPTVNANFWTGPFVAVQDDTTATIERLRGRRVELRAQGRDLSRDAANATQALENAQRAFRAARAQYAAVGGPVEEVTATRKALTSAEKAAERAAERERETQDALEFIEREVVAQLHRHGPDLLGILNRDAEAAQEQAERALNGAALALAAWHQVALRQQMLVQAASDPRFADLRPPINDLGEVVKSLDGLRGNIPAGQVGPAIATPDQAKTRVLAEAA